MRDRWSLRTRLPLVTIILSALALVAAMRWPSVPLFRAPEGVAALVGVAAALLRSRTATALIVQRLTVWTSFIAVLLLALVSELRVEVQLWFLLLLVAMYVALLLAAVSILRSGGALPLTATRSQAKLVGLIVALALSSLLYRLLVVKQLEQTAALFIGIPAFFAILVVVGVRPASAEGAMVKATTLALLISGIFLGEGLICILMASPLFFAVALVVGVAVERTRNRSRGVQTTTMGALLLLLLPMSLEGVHPALSFSRGESVMAERLVSATPAQVAAQLAAAPIFTRDLPLYLQLGFPRPTHGGGEGLRPGARRVIRFAGGEGKPGELVMEVAEVSEERVLFRAVSDSSHIAHWLKWESAEVTWHEVAPGETRVQWRFTYERLLDPAWYFAPWERYATRLAAGYLIDTLATPQEP